MTATVHAVEPDGSIAVLVGFDDHGLPVRVAADHRMAADIAEAIEDDGPVEIVYEAWQVVG